MTKFSCYVSMYITLGSSLTIPTSMLNLLSYFVKSSIVWNSSSMESPHMNKD